MTLRALLLGPGRCTCFPDWFGLVGLITMMASRYHQRVGDHMARTLVVGASNSEAAYGQSESEQTGGFRVEDERLTRPDMYSDNT